MAKDKGQVSAASTSPTVLYQMLGGNASVCFHVSVCFSSESGHHCEKVFVCTTTEDPLSLTALRL